jgi:putative transposase
MKTVYTPAFKAQVVLELLKEEKSLSQLAGEYKIHPNVLREWRNAAVNNLASLFERGDDVAKLRASYEQQLDELYGQIGRLTTQLAWVKKKSGLDPDKSGTTGDDRSGRR